MLLLQRSHSDKTLVAGADYGSQSVNLTFVRGSMLECHNVSILQDDDCEQPPEDFFADLAYVSGIQPIDINIPTTQVIIDDSGELECGKQLSKHYVMCVTQKW